MSSQFSLIWNYPSVFFVLNNLNTFEGYCSVLWTVPQFGFVWYFLMVKFMLCIFVKNTMEVILCLDQDIVSEDVNVTSDIINDVNFKVVSASLLHLKLLIFPFVSNKQLVGRYWDYTNILFLSYLYLLILSFTLDYCLKQLLLWWTLSFWSVV